LPWATAAVALAVIALSFAATGELVAGAVVATRQTARLSALVFAAALVARAGRPRLLGDRRVELTLAFVAAHLVHFASVIARAFVEPGNGLRHPSPMALAVVTGGLALILLIALTARAASAVGARVNAVAFYVAFGLLAAALGKHAATYWPAAVAFTVLLAAFVWRVGCALASPLRSAEGG
jgi:hypothetical protein